MASNMNCFLIWVPSSEEERREYTSRKTRDWSRTPAIEEEDEAEDSREGSNHSDDHKGDGDEDHPAPATSKVSKFEVTKIIEVDSVIDAPAAPAPSISSNANINGIGKEISDDDEVIEKTENNYPEKSEELVNGGGDSKLQHQVSTTDSVNNTVQDGFLAWETLEDIVNRVLADKDVKSLHCVYTHDNKFAQITFSVPFDDVENLLLELQNNGIGIADNSSITVIPSSVFVSDELKKPVNSSSSTSENPSNRVEKFYSSVKSRLMVMEVMSRIKAGAEFTFDFVILLILASMIAFMGLVENSSVVLVASMLVSPLMGPILAGIFGGAVHDKSLIRLGVKHEVYCLVACVLIGFLLGLMIIPWVDQYLVINSSFPTPEMMGRADYRSLWVGTLIAIPSGAGVALSVLGGNSGSLVGVAISASLLPPAVNCGIWWALAAVEAARPHTSFIGFSDYLKKPSNVTDDIDRDAFYWHFSDDKPTECLISGVVSLTLTILNILCIIVTGVLILKLKEVTPEKVPQQFSNFWRKDVRVHRDYYKAIRKGDDEKTGAVPPVVTDTDDNILHTMWLRAEQDEDLLNIRQWVTMASGCKEQGSARPLSKDEENPFTFRLFSPEEDPLMSTQKDYIPAYNPYVTQHNWVRNRSRSTSRPPVMRQAGYYPNTVNMGNYFNVSEFLEKEYLKSREFRQKLNETDNK